MLKSDDACQLYLGRDGARRIGSILARRKSEEREATKETAERQEGPEKRTSVKRLMGIQTQSVCYLSVEYGTEHVRTT